MSRFHVTASWDEEALVWTSQSDVPGLVIEAATLTEFEVLVQRLAPQLLADNAVAATFAGERVEIAFVAARTLMLGR